MEDQTAIQIPRLIVFGVHLFDDRANKLELKAWEGDIKRLKSDRVTIQIIRLSLKAILEEKDHKQAYADEMHKFKNKFIAKHKRFSGVGGWSRLSMKAKGAWDWSVDWNTGSNTKARSDGFIRYMIIADELAAWMAKDLMNNELEIRKRTVSLIFRGHQMPLTPGTKAVETVENILAYLTNLENLFGGKNRRDGEDGLASSDDERGLCHVLQQTNDDFENILDSTVKHSVWQIAIDKHYFSFTEPEKQSVYTDLRTLTAATIKALQSSEKSDSLDTVRGRLIVGRLEQARRSYKLPFVTNERGNGNNNEDETRVTNTQQETTDLVTDSQTLASDGLKMMRELKNEAMSHYESSPKNADQLFAACAECSIWASEKLTKERLEIDLHHGITWLHIGRYHDATEKLKKALECAEMLVNGLLEKTDDSGLAELKIRLLFWYSTALVRIGYQEIAQEKLEQVIQEIDVDNNASKCLCHPRLIDIQVKARLTLVLIKNQKGDFQSMNVEDDLRHSKELLDELERNSFRKETQSEQKQYMKSGSDHTEREREDASANEKLFIGKMYASRPALLRQQYHLIRSQILILRGNIAAARDILENVLIDLKEWLGPNNVLTLEAAVLFAGLLVSTPRVAEGERLAVEARKRVYEHLNKGHPLAMDATYALIIACTSQGRDEEALRLSQQLCGEAENKKIFGIGGHRIMHPRVSSYYIQLSDAHVAVGNYQEAESCLQENLFEHYSNETDILDLIEARNLSHLSWALLHLGKYQGAKVSLNDALEKQLFVFFSVPKSKENSKREFLDNAKNLLQQSRDNDTSIGTHPDILFTLQVCSELESRQIEPAVDFVLKTRKTLCTGLETLLGTSSADSLRARLSLGHAMNASGHTDAMNGSGHTLDEPGSFTTALENFEQVFKRCGTEGHLYQDHPLSLEAKREYWLSKIMLGLVSETGGEQSAEVLGIVLSSQQRCLGPYRTETLRTGLCHLSATIAVFRKLPQDETKALLERLREDFLYRLRNPTVQEQRLVESLLMEERLAHIYSEAGEIYSEADFYETSVKILKELSQRVEGKHFQDSEIRRSCDEISRRASKHREKTETMRSVQSR